MASFSPDLAFFSFVAIDADHGFLSHEPGEADYVREVITGARRAICLTDASKFTAPGRILAAARLECEATEHRYADGRCIMCRDYDPNWPPVVAMEPIAPPARCNYYTVDQGCPRHGEFCGVS